jgi:hypothetical protein
MDNAFCNPVLWPGPARRRFGLRHAGVLVAEILPRRDMAPVIMAAALMAFLLLFTKLRSVLERA